MNEKLCKDCVYFSPQPFPSPVGPSCRAPQSYPSVDLVYGHTRWRRVNDMRFNEDCCGKDGKWFKSKSAQATDKRVPPVPPPSRTVAESGSTSGGLRALISGLFQKK